MGNTNLISGEIVSSEANQVRVQTAAAMVIASGSGAAGDKVILQHPPRALGFSQPTRAGMNRFTGHISQNTFLGESSEHVLLVGEQPLRFISSPPMMKPPQEVTLECDPSDVVVLHA